MLAFEKVFPILVLSLGLVYPTSPLKGQTPSQDFKNPQETWILQMWQSPRGITLKREAPPQSPIKLRAYSITGELLWEKEPGDDANLRIQWSPMGTILALVTNNQETDRELWTENPESQNHLILIDPRDGTILQQHDTDVALQSKMSNPKTLTLVWQNEAVDVVDAGKKITLPFSPRTIEELDRPKKIGTPTSVSWETTKIPETP